MRPVVVLCLLAALAVPTLAAAAQPQMSGDGTLFVRNATGKVRVDLKSGVVIGRVGTGKIEILEPGADCDDPSFLVWNADRQFRSKKDNCVWTTSGDDPMRFRLTRGENDVRLIGAGLWLSAVGRGRAFLNGDSSTSEGRDGSYALNGGPFKSLPDDGDWFAISGAQ